MRRGEYDDQFFLLCNDHLGYQEYEFSNRVCHIREADIDQEIYGSPEYISALQSAWLNESATSSVGSTTTMDLMLDLSYM
jgi:capsid portal protein